MKSLYFNLAYVFLFSAKTGIYKQNTHTHINKVERKTLYFKFVCVSRTVIQLIMWVNKPTVAYKLVQLCSIIIKTHTQKKTINNLKRIN